MATNDELNEKARQVMEVLRHSSGTNITEDLGILELVKYSIIRSGIEEQQRVEPKTEKEVQNV